MMVKKESKQSNLQTEYKQTLKLLEARQAELSVINTIQDGLSAKLDIDTIFERVGDRIAEIFPGEGIAIYTVDPETLFGEARYILEDGKRHYPPPLQAGPIGQKAAETKQPLMLSTRAEYEAIGAVTIEGTSPSLSGMYIPLIVNGLPVGGLNIESTQREHAFTESDLKMAATIAGSLSVALENARLFDESQRRASELTIINDVQAGLAARIELQEIYDLVGDRVQEIFDAQVVVISRFDVEKKLNHYEYTIEKGERFSIDPQPFNPIIKQFIKEGKTILVNEGVEEWLEEGGSRVVAGEPPLSVLVVPLLQDEQVVGAVSLQNVSRENAFSSSDVQLLETLTASLSVALENARLFKETEERNAELAIINKVQTALASKIDIQGIYEVIGDKIHEVFPDAQVVDILNYEQQTQYFHPRYVVERGKRYEVDPWRARGFRKHVVESGEPLVINHDMEKMMKEYDNEWVVLGEFAKSWIGVPMKVGDQVTGVISLQHIDRENAFSDSDVRLIQTLSNSMSVALENARLFKETEERNAELAIINTVQRALAAQLDIQGIYEAVGEKLREIFDSQIIAIYSADLTRRINNMEYAFEKGVKFEPTSQPFTSLHEHLINLNDTYVFNGNFPEFAAQFKDYKIIAGEMPKSLLGVPVTKQRESNQIVTLTLQDIDGEKIFTDSDVRLLETLANSMSVALDNARLFDETQRLLKETEQRAAELQIINSVQVGLASKLEMQAIYDLVGDKIREIFKSDTTFIAFHDPENEEIFFPYYVDKGQRNPGTSRPYRQGLTEMIIESGGALIFNTAEESIQAGAYQIASPGSDKDLNQSFLGVPILREGKTIGATSIQSYEPYAFNHNDLALLQTLTNSMSVALDNARLFDETQHLLEQTEMRAAELATINAVGQALVAESELEALIHLIGEKMRATFAADIVYVALLEEGDNLITFPYTYGEDLPPLKLGEGLSSKIIQSGEPLLINQDIDKRRAEMGVKRVGISARSYLGVPIQFGGQTFGVISVQSTSEEGRFNERDLELLTTIAANVGTAIRNAQLFDEVKRQKQYYEAVIENSPTAIILVDMDANVMGWNPAAERLFGYTETEALGQNIDDLVASSRELHPEAVQYSEKAMREKQVHLLAQRTRKDGSLVDVEVSGLPVYVDGEYVGLIVIYHDVTELQRARQEAEEANRAKSTFLANMSHELRTPLNAITGFTRIVKRKGVDVLPEKQIENLDKVLLSADHLLNLIDTVLDISKIEAGRMDVKPTSFELTPLIKQVVDTSQPLLREDVDLTMDLQQDIPEMFSDQDKLKQIMLNLLSNAAKFTHKGEIRLAAHHDGELLYMDVSDTGIGVSEEALKRIFEDFQQADSSTTREYGGTGLGLPISRSLARLLGGELKACSIEGEGSTFTLTIPLQYVAP